MKEIDNKTEINDLSFPAVIKFGAPWCKPCNKIEPDFVKLAEIFDDMFFYKINIENTKGGFWDTFLEDNDILAIPAFAYLKDKDSKPVIVKDINKLPTHF